MRLNASRDRPTRAAEHGPVTPAAMRLIIRENGIDRTVRAHAGEPLLFALARADVSLAAICGGQGACGTCRVHIPAVWRDRLAEPTRREVRLLDFTGAAVGDRLACRVSLDPGLDGLEIHACPNPKGDE